MPELLESPKPNINPPRHDTRDEMKAVVADAKKAKSRRPWWITAVVLPILGAGGAGAGGMVMGDDAKEKAAASRQKLDDHISVERDLRRRHEEAPGQDHDSVVQAPGQEARPRRAAARARARSAQGAAVEAAAEEGSRMRKGILERRPAPTVRVVPCRRSGSR
jgi:hypothetical protein